jgi:hypothetical protein
VTTQAEFMDQPIFSFGGDAEPLLIGLAEGTNLYAIDPDTGEATLLSSLTDGDNASLTGISYLAGDLYGTDIFEGPLLFGTIDPDTGVYTGISDQEDSWNWQGLATDEEAGLFYTIDGDDNNILKSITADGTVTSIGTGTGITGEGMAYDDGNDILYATNGDGGLYTVDVTTGVATLVGLMGIVGGFIGLAYDEVNDVLYANDANSDSLYALDVNTGQATLIGENFAANINGLAWVGPTDTVPDPGFVKVIEIGFDSQRSVNLDTDNDGDPNDDEDNILGTDPFGGLAECIFIDSLPEIGQLLVDFGSDGVVDVVLTQSDIEGGGFMVTPDDVIYFYLPESESDQIAGPVNFDYHAGDCAGWLGDGAVYSIALPAPAVQFDIMVMSGVAGNDASGQQATISEEDAADNFATVRITLSGDALQPGDTASVTLTVDGAGAPDDATEDSDFTQAVIAAIAAAASDADIGISGQTATSLTLTWESGDLLWFDTLLTATNDTENEELENLILTLSGETADTGSVSLTEGKESAQIDIVDDDASAFVPDLTINARPAGPGAQMLLMTFSDDDGLLSWRGNGEPAAMALDLSSGGRGGPTPLVSGSEDGMPSVAYSPGEAFAVALKFVQGSGMTQLTGLTLYDEIEDAVLDLQTDGALNLSDGQGSGAQAVIWILAPDANGGGAEAYDVSEPIQVFISDESGVDGLNEVVFDSHGPNNSFALNLGLLSLSNEPSNDVGPPNPFEEDLFGETESIDITGSHKAEANLLSLSPQDVMDLQEADPTPELFITGGKNDSVELIDPDGVGTGTDWETGTSNGGFTDFTFGSVTVQIDDTIVNAGNVTTA